jgi:hypothetical protein
MNISPYKNKTVYFLFNMGNIILEQVNTFIYVGCKVFYQGEKGMDSSNPGFLKLLLFLCNTLKADLVQTS